MSPAIYPDFSWFVRAVRMLVLVAAAGLGGAIIGGFSVYGIVTALPPRPHHDVRVDVRDGSAAAPGRAASAVVALPRPSQPEPSGGAPAAVATTGASAANPSAAPASTPLPAVQTPTTAAMASPPSTWPDAFSHARHYGVLAPAKPEDAAAAAAPASKSNRTAALPPPPTVVPLARRPEHGKRRNVALPRSAPPMPASDAGKVSAANARPVYDYAGDASVSDDPALAPSTHEPPRTGRGVAGAPSKPRAVRRRPPPDGSDHAEQAQTAVTPSPRWQQDLEDGARRWGGGFFRRDGWNN